MLGRLTGPMGGVNWSAAEIAAVKAFVKTLTGDELGSLPERNSAWKDLERKWKRKGFSTTRTARSLGVKHRKLRKKAGRAGDGAHWSDAEEKALLAFVKERTGSEFGSLGETNSAWGDLEREWKGKGFSTERTTRALGRKHYQLRQERAAKKPVTPHQSITTTATSTTAAMTPSASKPGRKRDLATASASPASAQKTKAPPSPPPP